MIVVYRAANILEAHIVAGMLEAEGISAHVAGHYLQGGVGELAPLDISKVEVSDADYDTARTIVMQYESAPRMT